MATSAVWVGFHICDFPRRVCRAGAGGHARSYPAGGRGWEAEKCRPGGPQCRFRKHTSSVHRERRGPRREELSLSYVSFSYVRRGWGHARL